MNSHDQPLGKNRAAHNQDLAASVMNSEAESTEFLELRALIRALRGEPGCPWDKKQNPSSLKKYLLEESAELAEAIDQADPAHVREELGDLFFLLALLTRLYEEQGAFSMEEVLNGINAKMVRRHPHVFAGLPAGDEAESRARWEAIKAAEKGRAKSS